MQSAADVKSYRISDTVSTRYRNIPCLQTSATWIWKLWQECSWKKPIYAKKKHHTYLWISFFNRFKLRQSQNNLYFGIWEYNRSGINWDICLPLYKRRYHSIWQLNSSNAFGTPCCSVLIGLPSGSPCVPFRSVLIENILLSLPRYRRANSWWYLWGALMWNLKMRCH